MAAKEFIVNTTLTDPAQFNCSGLDKLMRQGHLKGEYMCQGKTVSDNNRTDSGAGGWGGPEAGIVGFGVVLGWVLQGWVGV